MNNQPMSISMSQGPATRFLSRTECDALARRAASMAVGGGDTAIVIESTWSGNLRYARNELTTTGDVRENHVFTARDIFGARASVSATSVDDVGLKASIRRAERILRLNKEQGERVFREHFISVERKKEDLESLDLDKLRKDSEFAGAVNALEQTVEEHSQPKIFFDTTYNLGANERVREIEPLIDAARKADLRAAGYVQVSAHGRAVINTLGRSLYYPYTQAQFSVTVRDPKGVGSGWAGVDFSDWTRVTPALLSEIAMDKCMRSRNPVAVEPGRYTAILEPQAVSDIFSPITYFMDRAWTEANSQTAPFGDPERKGYSRIGQRVLDSRITMSADPMDPDLGFPPFSLDGEVFRSVNWIENGVLKELDYRRSYGIQQLGINRGLPNSKAYRLSGGTSSIEEMIATTKRGLLVTRFSGISGGGSSVLCTGYTRDGLWLVENGKITKAVKNFRILESPLFIFNNLESLGTPVRVFRPGFPTVVPPAKVRDFSFTSLSEAI